MLTLLHPQPQSLQGNVQASELHCPADHSVGPCAGYPTQHQSLLPTFTQATQGSGKVSVLFQQVLDGTLLFSKLLGEVGMASLLAWLLRNRSLKLCVLYLATAMLMGLSSLRLQEVECVSSYRNPLNSFLPRSYLPCCNSFLKRRYGIGRPRTPASLCSCPCLQVLPSRLQVLFQPSARFPFLLKSIVGLFLLL